jgi:hypothetical protein
VKKQALQIAALIIITTTTLTAGDGAPARAYEPGSTLTSVSLTDVSDTALATDIQPRRWVAQWQMWDWTQYRSNATCMSRGRQIMRAFPDVEKITCRKPPRCNYWNLFTFRKQWV